MSPDNERVYAYTKDHGDERPIVTLNFTSQELSYNDLPSFDTVNDSIGNYPAITTKPAVKEGRVELRPREALVLVVS